MTSLSNNVCYIYINGIKRKVKLTQTILQACESFGISIPHFCYHDTLSIAGNCRMCLVEESKSIKPVASCAIQVQPNMDIYTETFLVKKAREGVLEFLLINHPLDCPICDQGGECDLQDQSIVFGADKGRYYEVKRAVEDKNFGPLVKTIMTRCIHCTRCVRFARDIAGFETLGITSRGSSMEIGFYKKNIMFSSEISGNVIDLCPVGALTSKPSSFNARSWDLIKYNSFDIFDSLLSALSIEVDQQSNKIRRILPMPNRYLNSSWISDKVRFSYDAWEKQRLLYPLFKQDFFSSLEATSWSSVFSAISSFLNVSFSGSYGFFSGAYNSCENITYLKQLGTSLGSSNFYLENSISKLNIDFRSNYLMTDVDSEVLKQFDFILVINSNLKIEFPVLNIFLRQQQALNPLFNVYSIGAFFTVNYNITHLGNNLLILDDILMGKHWLCYRLLQARKPLIIVNSSILNVINLLKIQYIFAKYCKNIIKVLVPYSGFINAMELNFNTPVPLYVLKEATNNLKNFFFFSNFREFNTDVKDLQNNKNFLIYMGTHGNISLNNFNVILPCFSFIEQSLTFIGLYGHIQKSSRIFNINNLSILYPDSLIFKNLIELVRKEKKVVNELILFYLHKSITQYLPSKFSCLKFIKSQFKVSNFSRFSFICNSLISNFYLDGLITKNSKVMAQASQSFKNVRYIF